MEKFNQNKYVQAYIKKNYKKFSADLKLKEYEEVEKIRKIMKETKKELIMRGYNNMREELKRDFKISVQEFCESCIRSGLADEQKIIKEYIAENIHMINDGIITEEDVEEQVNNFFLY